MLVSFQKNQTKSKLKFICFTVMIFLGLLSTACNIVMPQRQHSGTEETWKQNKTKTVQTVHFLEGRTPFCMVFTQWWGQHSGTNKRSMNFINCTVSLQWISNLENAKLFFCRPFNAGCVAVSLVGNSDVSLELQYFTAQLITYILCGWNALECSHLQIVQ